jgi:hypothetical protein
MTSFPESISGSSVVIVTALGAASSDWPEVGLVETRVFALATGEISRPSAITAKPNTFFMKPPV